MNGANTTASHGLRRSPPLRWGGGLLLLCALLAGLLIAAPDLAPEIRTITAVMGVLVAFALLAGLRRSLAAWQTAPAADATDPRRNPQIAQLFQMLPGCAWRADESLRYTEFLSSPDTLFGIGEQELTGQPLWSWTPDETRRRKLHDSLAQAIAERHSHLDLAWQPGEGESARWIGETLYLKYGDDGRLQFIVGLSSDITERKRKENDLAAMQQHARKMEAVGTLVGGIAHEFNNMLAGMMGNLFLLKSETDDPKQRERLERIETLIQRAARLIDQMLTFGRKQPAKMRRVALNDLLRDFVQLEESRLPGHVRLDVAIGPPAPVRADPVQIRQMLGSLLQNAVDAVADTQEASIAISLDIVNRTDELRERFPHMAPAARAAHLTIRDNGCGIPRKHLARVFDPFFTTKEVGSGTGMGLSMAYGVMETLGGAIALESEEGRGTTVHLYFPLADEEQDQWVRDDSGEVFLGQGETLLLADDEDLVREAACGVLRRLGYQVLAAADGAEALDLVREHGDMIDLVILDLIMPDLGGMEAAKRIRRLQPDMPLIFITGYDLNDTLDRKLHMANADLVRKPFNVSELSRAVRRLLTAERD